MDFKGDLNVGRKPAINQFAPRDAVTDQGSKTGSGSDKRGSSQRSFRRLQAAKLVDYRACAKPIFDGGTETLIRPPFAGGDDDHEAFTCRDPGRFRNGCRIA